MSCTQPAQSEKQEIVKVIETPVTGQLKYVDALRKILELSNLKKYTRAIIGRQILWLSAEWYPFASNENERKMPNEE
jgi:hypothetical protein